MSPPLTRIDGEASPSSPSSAGPVVTDEQLLLDVRAGDPGAYAEIYRRYVDEARRYAASLVPRELVDDIVAESFAKMLNALRGGHGPTDHPVRYLMVVVRNTTATFRSRSARHHAVLQAVEVPEPVELVVPLRADDDVVVAFHSLSERWRQVIVWSELDGLTPAEIGGRLGLSAAAVSALTYRARRGLRDAYFSQLADAASA